MKKLLFLIIAFFLIKKSNAQIFSNTLEENPNWINYNLVVEKIPFGNNNYWKYEYILKNGKIDTFKSSFNEELRAVTKLIYDDYSYIKYEIQTFDINHGSKNDTLLTNIKVNENGLRIEDNYSKYIYNKNKQLERRYSKIYETSNEKQGWSEKYIYDDLGNILRTESTTIIDGVTEIDIEEFTYDKCKNIQTINRSSAPEKEYPIIMIGGRSKYQEEKFEYEYNSECLWTKKYLLVDNKKTLISVREIQ